MELLDFPKTLPFESIPADTRLTTEQLARTLTSAGLPVSAGTLNTKASRGGGPPYQMFGRLRIYTWKNVVPWVISKLGDPAASATERRIRARSKNASLASEAHRQCPS
jgi:hypothetical protein